MYEEEGSEDTFFIPGDAVQGHDCAAGDKLTFEVLGKDSEGDIEVRLMKAEKASADDFDEDLKGTFDRPVPEPMPMGRGPQ